MFMEILEYHVMIVHGSTRTVHPEAIIPDVPTD